MTYRTFHNELMNISYFYKDTSTYMFNKIWTRCVVYRLCRILQALSRCCWNQWMIWPCNWWIWVKYHCRHRVDLFLSDCRVQIWRIRLSVLSSTRLMNKRRWDWKNSKMLPELCFSLSKLIIITKSSVSLNNQYLSTSKTCMYAC